MKITFLGTGTSQGVPVIACPCSVCKSTSPKDKRLRSSVLVELDKTTLVIDAGPDFRYQMLRNNVKTLEAILITHCHKDHIAGLDDVRSYNYLQKKPMDIYASKRDQEAIKQEFSYAFREQLYPGVPVINLYDIQNGIQIGDVKVKVLPVLHMKMEVYGYRIGNFAYITDANYIPEDTMTKLLDCKVIVLNALRKEPHVSHYNLEEAVRVLEFLRPEKAYLTHISHLMGFHNEVEKELPEFICLAYDGLEIKVD
ncbi:MAG: MBL fold metallo-hydrolase [Bacteroidales bacterium]|jgi:phosphoribosyl 1,2-cyclic phosphate phosphodiesterase|nr:MBL fold metallo-hydrolase [Bacteroidales bacterium]